MITLNKDRKLTKYGHKRRETQDTQDTGLTVNMNIKNTNNIYLINNNKYILLLYFIITYY